MKKLNKKGLGILYGVALFSFSIYALLDTFVIPHPMQGVMASNVVAETTNSGIKESVEAAIEEKLNSGTSTSNNITAGTNVSSDSAETENSDEISGATVANVQTVEGGTVIGEYSDSNTSITLKQYRAYDSNIYVADVTVSDVSVLIILTEEILPIQLQIWPKKIMPYLLSMEITMVQDRQDML